MVFDLSAIRPRGAPIGGMQGRPASGPVSMLRALLNIRRHVVEPARSRGAELPLWEQALLVDHHLSVEVQVGGARRAARMATKSWRDPGIFRFIRCKSEGGMWTANNSVMVDREFWQRVGAGHRAGGRRRRARSSSTRSPGMRWRCSRTSPAAPISTASLASSTATGWKTTAPAAPGTSRSTPTGAISAPPATRWTTPPACWPRCRAGPTRARFPVTTNPCGEIVLHVTGGYCVIADFAPLLACPGAPEDYVPGCIPDDVAALWDARVEESVRLGVRFLSRANTMDALYAEEVKRTNRMGIGPTGLHEWAWVRFGLAFDDLLDERAVARRSGTCWRICRRSAKQEGDAYAAELGRPAPFTVTTVKPAGTTSKLFGLTEGAHLPARRQYLRWVMFQGTKDDDRRLDARQRPAARRVRGARLSGAHPEQLSRTCRSSASPPCR